MFWEPQPIFLFFFKKKEVTESYCNIESKMTTCHDITFGDSRQKRNKDVQKISLTKHPHPPPPPLVQKVCGLILNLLNIVTEI